MWLIEFLAKAFHVVAIAMVRSDIYQGHLYMFLFLFSLEALLFFFFFFLSLFFFTKLKKGKENRL